MSDSTYWDLLERIICDGIAAATQDYERGDAETRNFKLSGSIAGFNACRNREPKQLAVLLEEARLETRHAHADRASDYWFWRCRELEIEWVCNVISAVLMNQGLPTIIPPTSRGVIKAAEIAGVSREPGTKGEK